MKQSANQADLLHTFYEELARLWGPQHWWPARSRFEMITGAYLTQNTAWTNVERALANLRQAHVLSLAGLRRISLPELEQLIRPAGYFRQKAQRLKIFVAFLDTRYGGSFRQMFAQPTEKLREELLALNGVGPETADSILLYAGNHPVFVVDAYTRRVLDRHGILPAHADYEEIRKLWENSLGSRWPLVFDLWPEAEHNIHHGGTETRSSTEKSGQPSNFKMDVLANDLRPTTDAGPKGAAHRPSAMSLAKRTPLAQVYSEMHALLVGVGKNYCAKSKPKCEGCPLKRFLPVIKD